MSAGMIIKIENGKAATASLQERNSATIKLEKNAER
jgi:hypothetical protein